MSVFPTDRHLGYMAGSAPAMTSPPANAAPGTPARLQVARLDARGIRDAAIRTKDVYLAAQYTRLKPRRGHKKALGAVKHSIICACWHMLTTGELYNDLGGDYYQRRDPEREAQRLVKRLKCSDTSSRSNQQQRQRPRRLRQPERYFPVSSDCRRRRVAARTACELCRQLCVGDPQQAGHALGFDPHRSGDRPLVGRRIAQTQRHRVRKR